MLHQVAGNNAAIFGKVRVAYVVEPKTGLSISARQEDFNKISAKHFDFLLCDKDELIGRLTLNWTMDLTRAKRPDERDEFLKEVCEAAGVPLVQVPAKPAYVINEVKRLIAPYHFDNDTPYKEQLQTPGLSKS